MGNSFFIRLILSSLASSVVILLILFTKKVLKKHISIRWQYNMGLLVFILLIFPFIPTNLLNFTNMGSWLLNGLHAPQTVATEMAAIGGGTQTVKGMSWLQDFTISVDRATPGYIVRIFMLIWLAGFVTLAILTFSCNKKLRLITESMKSINDNEIVVLFAQCKAELGIKNNILFGMSILVNAPMTIGFFRTRIILPIEIWKTLPKEDIRYILLHELTHCKNKDIPINNLMCLFQILYWFNPLVYLAFKEMRLDREMACDLAVLNRIPEEQYINYGNTLLKFVHNMSSPAMLSFAADMGGTKRHIKKRVENIATFKAESILLKIKSICVFTLIGLLIFSQVPAISALAAYDDSKYHFEANNVIYEDLSLFFDGFDGSFVLYDMEDDLYTIYNRDKSVTRVSPASTYKIYSALIALETGVIETERSVQEWDGTAYPYEAWNRDQNLTSAMQNSVSWYFQNIDAKVGIKELGDYYTKLSYGNCDLSGGITNYMMESSLRISPVEQVILLKNLCNNDTIFKAEYVDTVKDTLRLSGNGSAVLSGKTGTGSVNDKVINGWFIGYVENNERTFVFATNIGGKDKAGGSVAVQITLDIIKSKGIY